MRYPSMLMVISTCEIRPFLHRPTHTSLNRSFSLRISRKTSKGSTAAHRRVLHLAMSLVDLRIPLLSPTAGIPRPKTLPKPTIPKATLPKPTIPKATVPKATVPKGTLPKATLPKAAIPKVTPPKTTLPKPTIPRAALPKALRAAAKLPSKRPGFVQPAPK